MSLGWAVANRFGMSVRFCPDNFRSKPPTRVLQGKGETPWKADQVFGFQSNRRRGTDRHGTSPVFFVRSAIPAITRGVGVPHV